PLALDRRLRQADDPPLPAPAAGAVHQRAPPGARQPPHREARRAHRRRDLARRRRHPPTELIVVAGRPGHDTAVTIAGFVGRGRGLDQRSRGLDDAVAGRGRLFLLAGEPGIGKTAACDALTTAASARGLPVFWGRAWEAGGAPAYWPWLDVVAGLARRL